MSLQHYLQMNTGWTDASGNGYNGAPNGAVINNVDQKLGAGCGDFLTNDDVGFATFFDPSGLTKAGMMGWIQSDAGAVNKAIYGWWHGASGTGFMLMSANSGEGFTFYFANGLWGRINVIDTSTALVHVAVAYDGDGVTDTDKLKIYFNSVLQTLVITGPIPTSITANISGVAPKMGSLNGANFWDGLIDNWEVYNNTPTQADVNASYNGGAGREINNGLFFFNEE